MSGFCFLCNGLLGTVNDDQLTCAVCFMLNVRGVWYSLDPLKYDEYCKENYIGKLTAPIDETSMTTRDKVYRGLRNLAYGQSLIVGQTLRGREAEAKKKEILAVVGDYIRSGEPKVLRFMLDIEGYKITKYPTFDKSFVDKWEQIILQRKSNMEKYYQMLREEKLSRSRRKDAREPSTGVVR